MSKPRSRRAVFAGRIALALLAIGLSLAARELALRLLGCEELPGHGHQSAPLLSENRDWGVWHYPNQVVDHEESCYHARYRTFRRRSTTRLGRRCGC